MTVLNLKGGNIVWNYAEDNIIEQKEDYREIGLNGFYYKSFEEEEDGGVQDII